MVLHNPRRKSESFLFLLDLCVDDLSGKAGTGPYKILTLMGQFGPRIVG